MDFFNQKKILQSLEFHKSQKKSKKETQVKHRYSQKLGTKNFYGWPNLCGITMKISIN